MREPREVEIDGSRYLIGTLPPRKGLKLGNRVLRAAGPGVLQLIQAMPDGDLGKVDLGAILPALLDVMRTVFSELTAEEQDSIMMEVLGPVQVVNGEKTAQVVNVFDAHFAGRLPAALKLTWEALKDNFLDFGPALAALVPSGKARASPSAASTTS
jgi:hypothetical protein